MSDDPKRLEDLIVSDDEAVRMREQRAGVTVGQIDAALKVAREEGREQSDDAALLWTTRAGLLGLTLEPAPLVLIMGVTHRHAEDIFARLSERGYVARVDAPPP